MDRSASGEDWRADYLKEVPETAPTWFVDDRTDVTHSLSSTQAPTLLMRGEDDHTSPSGVAELLSRNLPNAQLRTIPQAGHQLPREQPIKVAAAIQAFLV